MINSEWETNKAISDIEHKKKTITRASENEQGAIRAKIHEAFKKIGETVYTMHTEDAFEIEKISDLLEAVKAHHQTLDEKQAKLNEILNRYDEELKILRPPPPEGHAVCQSCGAAYIQGEMLFCSRCGNRHPAANAADTGPQAAPSKVKVCANCRTENITEAMFCSGCGSRL